MYRIVTYTPDHNDFAVQSIHATQAEAETQCAANRASGLWYLAESEIEDFLPLRPALCEAIQLVRSLQDWMAFQEIETDTIAAIFKEKKLTGDQQAVLDAWKKAKEVRRELGELVYRQEGRY